jgi:hypothetical protein
MITRDFSPVHKWIADYFFQGKAWIYNGSACNINTNTNTKLYVCRVRDMHKGQYSQSYVAIQRLDNNWNAMTLPIILPIITADNSKLKMDTGPQDARVFVFRGNSDSDSDSDSNSDSDSDVWIVFNMLCADGYRRMHLYNVTGTGNAFPITIDGKDRTHTEKNWTPFVFNNQLFFIYYFAPLVILRCDVSTGICSVIFSDQSEPKNHLRGGSPAIAHPDDQTRLCGFLHTTVGLSANDNYNPEALPLPARKTKHVYRPRYFELVFGRPDSPPKLYLEGEVKTTVKTLDDASEHEQPHQIEQIYGIGWTRRTGTNANANANSGWTNCWGILNIDDHKTVVWTDMSKK